MRISAISFSALVHIFVLIAVSITVPWTSHRDIYVPPPIKVKFAEMDKVTQVPEKKKEIKKAPKVTKKEPKVAVKPPKKPLPPPQKVKKEPSKPVPVKKKEIEKKAEVKEKIKKKVEEVVKPERDFASILKNLANTKEEVIEEQDEQIAPIGERLTINEEDALRQQLERCWNVPIGAKNIEDIVVEVSLEINFDKTVKSARIVDQNRYNKDSFFRAVADSTIRAVRNPMCSPLALPEGKYESWNKTTIVFNPKDMF